MKASKLTARGLAYVVRAVGRKIAKAHRAKQTPHGKQTVKKLMAHGASTNSLELSGDTKLFDRVARKWNGEPYRKINPRSGCSTNYGKFERTGSESSDGRRYPGNVLFVPTVTGGIHPTQKPVELCEYFIKTYTDEGAVVADICAGSGTTAVPFPSYLLTNNNANIRRVRQRIEELSHKAEFVGWTFPGGEAKVNEAENRLQLIFAEKPDADTRQALKSEGFKWAPSQGAWQRQLNQNAIRAAARLDFLRPEDGKSPYQLQPFAKRAEKDVSR